jgi:hypothetical protein
MLEIQNTAKNKDPDPDSGSGSEFQGSESRILLFKKLNNKDYEVQFKEQAISGVSGYIAYSF